MTRKELLARAGLRPTRQRLRILEELARERDDLTAQQLHRRLVDQDERIGLATVYRTLTALSEHGVVDSLAHRPSETCYRLCGEAHHHHLVCTRCHRVVELEGCGLEPWLAEAAGAAGFLPTEHRVEILGLCGTCR